MNLDEYITLLQNEADIEHLSVQEYVDSIEEITNAYMEGNFSFGQYKLNRSQEGSLSLILRKLKFPPLTIHSKETTEEQRAKIAAKKFEQRNVIYDLVGSLLLDNLKELTTRQILVLAELVEEPISNKDSFNRFMDKIGKTGPDPDHVVRSSQLYKSQLNRISGHHAKRCYERIKPIIVVLFPEKLPNWEKEYQLVLKRLK